MSEVTDIASMKIEGKKAREKKIWRYILLPLIAFIAVFTVIEIVNPTPNWEPAIATAPGWEPEKVAAAEEYKVKALANIDEIVALHHCDDLINEVNIAASLGEQNGPSRLANDYIYNHAYSSAVTLGCDMRDVLK